MCGYEGDEGDEDGMSTSMGTEPARLYGKGVKACGVQNVQRWTRADNRLTFIIRLSALRVCDREAFMYR